MQHKHSRFLRNRRIKSIAALSKSHLIAPSSKPINLNYKQFPNQSLNHSNIKQNQITQTHSNFSVEQVIKQMQFSINQITQSIKVKTEKQKYLELRLNQILTKQDQKINNLQSKLLILYEQQKKKDYQIQKLKQQITNTKMQIQKQNTSQICPQIIETHYSLSKNNSNCYQSPKFNTIEQKINEGTTRHGTDMKQSLSPFTSQPTD